MGRHGVVPYRIEVTLGDDSDISLVENEHDWVENGECEFVLKSEQGEEEVFYGSLEDCIEAMQRLEQLGLTPDTP